MANFDQLKQSVAALIRTNGAEEITGQIMQDVLLTIINSISGGYMFGGVAQHSGNVGNPDYNVFYLAGSGAYTGYGGAITIENGCYGVFRYNGTWHQEVVDIGVRLSGSIVAGETRGVTGDTINTALQTLFDNVMNILDSLTFTYNTPSAQQATKAMLDVIMTPTGGAPHVLTTLTLASATVAAAGLMSAEDKQKVDRMLTDFRSLSLTDTTAAADQATKIVQTLSATLGDDPEAITTFTLLAATASKAGLMSAADKAVLDCLVAMLGYYECSTAAGTAAKEVSASGYSLTSGGCIRIKMNNANTANNVTLNINSTGAKALYYDGAQASSTNTWEAGEVLEVYYDGTQYQCASGGGGVGVYDVSKDRMEYNGLSSALSAIPVSDRKSGMTINYIDSNTHKYEQCRYILQYENTTAGNTDFTNTDNWVNTDEDIKKLAQILTNDVVLTLADADIAPTYDGVEVSSVTSANRLHLVYEIPSGAVIKLKCTLNSGIAVSLYSTRADALRAGNNYIETYTNYVYTTAQINATSSQGGFLNISYKNASGGVMTQQEYDAFMANISVEIKIIGETDRLTEIEEDILSLQQETEDIPEIKENVELINSVLYGEESTTETRTLADADIAPTYNGSEVSSVTSANRLHLIYEIPSGAVIKLKCTLNSGIAVSLYSTRADALIAGNNYIETYTNYVYTTAQINATSSQGGFLNINYKNASGGVMTQQEYDAFMANVFVEITWTTTTQSGLIEKVNEIEASMLSSSSGENKLFVGEVEQGQRGTKQISSSSVSVAMSNTVGVPYERCAFKAFLPAGLKATILIGTTSETLSNGGNMTNGQTYQFPANVMYYSINFSKENGGKIRYEDVQDNIDNGSICFVITNSEAPTISRVSYNENFARMQMRGNPLSGQVNLLTIAHISDIHSDYVRARNFFEIAEFLNVAYAIHTGDVVGWPYNGFSFFKDVAKVYSGKKINVLGNHDVFDISEVSAFESAIEPFTSELGIETTTNYYYYDDATWNVRFIVMNAFENALANGHNQPDITGTQMNWLINTLSSIPANYGVILCYHIPANNIVSNNYGFYQNTVSVFHTMDGYGIGVKGSPIQKIINAFINKGQISDTYTSHGTAYSYTADFTSVPETAEFICHMTGHEHSDRVGYYIGYDGTIEGQAKQLVFNICSGVSLYGTAYPYLAHLSDCPRGGKGATQDAFNVMSIDRSNKTIALTRMGSFMTNLGEQRLVATIPYR